MASRTASLMLLMVFGACHGDPYHDEYLRQRPEPSQLVGTYSLRDGSAARLDIGADGTFELTDVPECWRTRDPCTAKTMSRTGTWKLVRIYDWWGIRLTSRENGAVNEERHSQVMLRGDRPPYLIHFIIGDPDQGEALVFRRVASTG